MQIRLDRLYALLAHEEQDQVYHYLVGTDGLLRSPLAGHEPDVLQKRIATPTFTQWQQIATSSTTQQYVNPLQKGVLGQHNSLTIGNIQWVLISEIDQAAAYSASNWLARFNLMLLVISTVIITTASLYVSKRLTRPITRLSATMEAFARNEPAYFAAMFEAHLPPDTSRELTQATERAFGILRQACEALITGLPDGKRPPALMMSLHVWAMAHGIASLFGRGDNARRNIPMSPEQLLEANMLIYLDGLGLGNGPVYFFRRPP